MLRQPARRGPLHTNKINLQHFSSWPNSNRYLLVTLQSFKEGGFGRCLLGSDRKVVFAWLFVCNGSWKYHGTLSVARYYLIKAHTTDCKISTIPILFGSSVGAGPLVAGGTVELAVVI